MKFCHSGFWVKKIRQWSYFTPYHAGLAPTLCRIPKETLILRQKDDDSKVFIHSSARNRKSTEPAMKNH